MAAFRIGGFVKVVTKTAADKFVHELTLDGATMDRRYTKVVEYSDCKLLRRQLLRAVDPQAELTGGHHHHYNWNEGFVLHCLIGQNFSQSACSFRA